jgi:hypothetical protein
VKRAVSVAIIAFFVLLLAGCGAPLHFSQTHTTSTPRPQSADVAELAREPVAMLGLLAPASSQGFSPFLSHALASALAQASPPIRGIPAYETVNVLNEQGLATEYAELISGFVRSGILDRERLRRVGSALGSRYLFLPGLAQFDQVVLDKFEAAGFKLVRNRVVTLRLWLQLWDTQIGRIPWESAGETTVGTQLLTADQAVPLDKIAQNLWLRMIQDSLLPQAVAARHPTSSRE